MGMLFSTAVQQRILELEDADTEDNYAQFEPVLPRAEEALIKAKQNDRSGLDYFESPANMEVYQSLSKLTPVQIQQQAIDTAKTIADVTPIIGEIKAASELPNDLAYAKELVKSGYDQDDLIQMGLGGAYSMLSAMSLVPGLRVGAKAGKTAVKKSFKEIMDEELAEDIAKDVKPKPPVVDEPPKEAPEPISTEEFLEKREKSGLMSRR